MIKTNKKNTKKKILTLTLLFSIAASAFTGCEKKYPPRDDSVPDYNRADFYGPDSVDQFENLRSKNIKKVMRNQKKVYDTASKTETYLKDLQYINYMTYELFSEKVAKFQYYDETASESPADITMLLWAEADIDYNGMADVLITLDNKKTLLLKDMGGTVNAYFFNYDDLHDIKADGSFILESSYYEMVGWFAFAGTTPEVGAITGHLNLKELGLSQELGIDDYYMVNGEECNASQYTNEIKNVQNKKEDIAWEKFTDNVL